MQSKFLACLELDEWEIETDTGFAPVSHLHLTKKYKTWVVTTVGGLSLHCADDHIVFRPNFAEVFIKNINVGDEILTENGIDLISSIVELDTDEHMFDFTVDNADHRYYTSGILSHNTSVATVIILHYALFNKRKKIGILANKADTAQEILSRIQLAYEYLPHWLKCGVVEWNKRRVEFDNGTIILAAASSASSIRGQSLSMLYLDEIAFVEHFDEFSASVLPTLSSGKRTRMIFTSTPNGLNHFFDYCEGAKKGVNGFAYLEVPWYDVPGRDEKWKEDILGGINHDLEKFKCEYECNFIGSSGTLISGAALKQLSAEQPMHYNAGYGYRVYEEPERDKQYVLIADVSRGKGLDFSAFHVIDVTQVPYRQVATFRNNMITPIDYAEFIYRSGKAYNDAQVLIEVNDIGGQVSDLLYYDYSYENIMHSETHGRAGKRISGGFGKNADRGIRTTKTVKAIGCSMLKLLIEQKKLTIVDKDTINELNTFSKHGSSYEAESGHNDDLVMGLVLFGWLSQDPFFKELNNMDIMHHLRERSEDEIMDELSSFGFRFDPSDEWEQQSVAVVNDGNWWTNSF